MARRVGSPRQRGQAGEREFSKFLTSLGLDAKRGLGQARGGGAEVPDVICEGLPGVHWEVKRTLSPVLHTAQAMKWREQATQDAPRDALPVIAYRWDRGPWMAGVCVSGAVMWMRAETLVVRLRDEAGFREKLLML